jgi:transposase
MKPPQRLHLEIQTHRAQPIGLIRSSYRDPDTQAVKHTQHGRITGLPLDQLKLIQAAFQGKVVPLDDPRAFRCTDSKEYGASYAVLQMARQLDLDTLLYSRNEPWVRDCLAMIAGRVVSAGSKLALTNQAKNSALWELCGVPGEVDVEDHCYKPMDRLLERQQAIQKALAKKHLRNGHVVLYDITSSYFEGAYEDSDIVLFGYNRDGKKGHEQVVLGLLCDERGCPVGLELFAGNTQDAQTVIDKIQELRQDYGLSEVTFVGDRGMITQANAEKLKDVPGLHTLSALTHRQMFELLERKVIQPELFDEQKIIEVSDPDQPQKRYCLCRNPDSQARERATRARLIELTRAGLDKLAGRQRKSTAEKLGSQVGRLLQRYKMGKFIQWQVKAGRLKYQLLEAAIAQEQLLDGAYIVTTAVAASQMKTTEVVETYKSLAFVEQAFRSLKTVALEIRPVYHKKDDRIRSHVFLCMLAYYVYWHMKQRLEPLFQKDGHGKHRQWTMENVIENLGGIRQQQVSVGGAHFKQISQPTAQQQEILDLLGIQL